MEALAQITAGIAPALGDLLTVIRGQAGVLLDSADHGAGASEQLKQIYTAAEKASSLIRQLLIFSRHQPVHARNLDLNDLINGTSTIIRRLLGGSIAAEFRLEAGLPSVEVDPDMIEQVLIVFAVNARDCMPTGGRLLIKTESVEITPDAAKAQSDCRPGQFVVLSVEDTGAGIAPEILPRIFEPFFTTKTKGKHTGLGLAAVSGVVQQHRGWLRVASRVGAGSEFRLFLPAATAGIPIEEPAKTEGRVNGGSEVILLVDDDIPVREFTTAVLQEFGYRVLQAGTVAEALEVWKWHGARIALLFTDMVLDDHMTGLDLAKKLRAEKPSLRAICTSGHSREIMERSAPLPGGCQFLPKPCRPNVLVQAVRTSLDAPSL